jgi:hypothetical protein
VLLVFGEHLRIVDARRAVLTRPEDPNGQHDDVALVRFWL